MALRSPLMPSRQSSWLSVPPTVGAIAAVITFITACVAFTKLLVSGSSAWLGLLPWVGRIYLLASAFLFAVLAFGVGFPRLTNGIRDTMKKRWQDLTTSKPRAAPREEK